MAGEQDAAHEETAEYVKSILTAAGGEMPMNRLNHDYKSLMGQDIPWQKLNYSSLAAFLQALHSAVTLNSRGGNVIVKLIESKETDFILKQVRGQKKSAPKNRRTKLKQNRHLHCMPALERAPKNPWSRFRGPPSYHQNHYHRMQPVYPQRQPYTNNHPFTHSTPKSSKQTLKTDDTGNKSSTRPAASGVEAKAPKPSAVRVSMPAQEQTNMPPRPIVPQPLLPNPPRVTGRAGAEKGDSKQPIKASSGKSTKPATKSGQYYNDGNFSIPRAIRNNQEKQFPPYYEVPPRFSNAARGADGQLVKTDKELLEEEVKKWDRDQRAVFRTIPWGKKPYWISTVTIGSIIVSSYPEELSKPEDAEELVARNALEKLQEVFKSSVPVTTDLAVSIARVKEILKSEGAGTLIWLARVQELYENTFREQLPADWPSQVQAYAHSGLLLENMFLNRWTVKLDVTDDAKPDKNSTVDVGGISQTPCEPLTFDSGNLQEITVACKELDVSEDEYSSLGNPSSPRGGERELPPLTLPTCNFWDIYVTDIEGFNKIHLRFIGEDYSSRYEDLLTDMELHYMEEKNLVPVSSPAVGEVYALNQDESWLRVEVLEVTESGVKVNFVDHGDTEVIELQNLYHLEDQFFSLPAQCVCCSLFGLEYGRKNVEAITLLQTLALGHVMVAQVKSRQQPPYSLVLYDTSTDEDVNINDKVLEHITNNFVEPKLPPVGGVVEVYLVHITLAGDVYVQVESETYRLLENLLETARSRTKEILGENVEIDLTKLYLAQFSEDGEWYRAAPRSDVDPDGKVQMWFMEFGHADTVAASNIRLLESLCPQLTQIPSQALHCRLYNVPANADQKWTQRACERMMELCSDDAPLLLKVQAVGEKERPPAVELFKRLNPQNELVSVNASLSLDPQLFSNEDDGNNNNRKVSPEQVLFSPDKCRSRQPSSTSSQGFVSGPSSLTGSSPEVPGEGGGVEHQEIPSVGEYFDVYVTYAASPGNFAIQSWKTSVKLESMMEKMQIYYEDDTEDKKVAHIEAGGYYAIKHNDDVWYRGRVKMTHQGIVTGLFVDFGDCFVSSSDRVRMLPATFCSLPSQAIKAKLHGVSPVNKDWSHEDVARFQALVECKEFVSLVKDWEKASWDCDMLSLQLIDTTDKSVDVYIDEILVNEGRAIKDNAPKSSK